MRQKFSLFLPSEDYKLTYSCLVAGFKEVLVHTESCTDFSFKIRTERKKGRDNNLLDDSLAIRNVRSEIGLI